MTSPSPQPDYKQEVRIAVVMYGGVSLAIYINGIAQELLRLVRSTSLARSIPATGTERVYQEVSRLLACESNGDEADNVAGPNSAPPTRFVVDIISGTSAGGINGIFLAKSLANGQNMDELKKLWVEEGAIERLINDKKSIEKPLALQDPPTSLLNSERMYFQLLKAFDGMEGANQRKEDADSPFVDELDLFVTSTDLQGVVLPIRLSDDLVYERRHRNVMHFVYSSTNMSGEATRNDFHGKYNPFLAFAARCTSAFPFAFEPMSLADIDTLLDKLPDYRTNVERKSDSNVWQRFYRDYLDPRGVSSVPFPRRAFGDGGYLDNKPFSYATETLSNRNADVPVDRKLIYIEPSPEHPEDDIEQQEKPDAIQNVLAALLTLPRYETIREDVQRVKDRNRLIERVNTITAGVDRDEYECETKFGRDTPFSTAHVWMKDKEIAQLDLADMIQRKGRTYAAYHRLRIAAVTDELANLIARVAGFDEGSDYFLIVRSMVRAWRLKKYVEYRRTPAESEAPTAGTFLYEFDLSYPIRRVNYLRNRADSLYRFEENAMTLINIQAKNSTDPRPNLQQQPFTPEQKAAFRTEILNYKQELNDYFRDLRKSARSLRSRHTAKDKNDTEKLAKQSPVKEQVQTLMAEIERTVKPLVDPNSRSAVLDYFLGKRSAADPHSSYKAGTGEDECTRRSQEFLDQHEQILELFQSTAESLRTKIISIKEEVEERSTKLFTSKDTNTLSPDPEINRVIWIAKRCLAHYYWNYEDYDALTYPVLYDTGVGEADTIDIIRISPEDAKQLIDERESGCHKLAGSALGHFGAFLQRSWRENDILWGRLDGAERLITALLPNHPERTRLIGEAQAEIMVDELSHLGDEERQALIAEALMRTRSRQAEPDLLEAFTTRLLNSAAGNAALSAKIKELIKPTAIRQYYVNQFRVRSKAEPEGTLRATARATTVVGKMLEDLSSQRRVNTKYALWIARLGVIFWALIEVAVPQSFPYLLFRHWLKLLYFLEVLLVAASILLVNATVQQFALTAFGVTVAIQLAVVILSDLIQTKNRWLNLTKAAVVIGLVGLVLIGVLTISALLGSNAVWLRAAGFRKWFVTPVQFGLNTKTFSRFGLLLTVLFFFLMSIRRDLRAFFKRTG